MVENEYIETDASTWRYWPSPERPSWFEKELVRIAGLNRHGKPNLRLVWGADVKDDRMENPQLKYLCGYTPAENKGFVFTKDGEQHFVEKVEDIPDGVIALPYIHQEPLGLPRWVIEAWTSPERLEEFGRFQTRYAEGGLDPVLRSFPREGIYETWIIISDRNGKYRNIERDLVEYVEGAWWYDQKPFEERERDRELALAAEAKKRADHAEEIRRAAANFDLRLSKDQKEANEQYWREKVDYQKQEQIARATGRWFVPELYDSNS